MRYSLMVWMCVLWSCISTHAQDLSPRIDVVPSLSVEVGEAVFFSAEGSTYPNANQLGRARYEWDFGDGYVMKFGQPKTSSGDSGMSALHYYMRPGSFEVTLTLSVFDADAGLEDPNATPIETAQTTTTIRVSGEAPMAGFELLHAPFHARIAQFVRVRIPPSIRADTSVRLVVSLVGNIYPETILFNRDSLQEEEQFLLEQRNLPADSYRLTAELRSSTGIMLSRWTEKFSKPYAGIPRVGINEWNAFCIDGEPFFAVTPYMLNKGDFAQFEGSMNTSCVIGYYNETPSHNHQPAQWIDYLNASQQRGWMAQGPGRGDYRAPYPSRNSRSSRIVEFVNSGRNHPALFQWDWLDEPNLGGRYKQVPPPVLASWTYVTQNNDPQHPVSINLYGYPFLPHYSAAGTYYDYINSADVFGGKRVFYTDALVMDIYPLEYRRHVSLFNKDRGVIDLWVQSINTFRDRNMDLVPVSAFVEVCDIRANRNTPGPTQEQVLMEAWLAVIHGAKAMYCFPLFEYDTIRYEAMREFKIAMDTYAAIILGPPPSQTVTDNSNVRNNRVDTLTREHAGDTYVFAVRLTEPEPLPDEIHPTEPATISTTFFVPGSPNGSVDVLNASGQQDRTIPLSNGTFTDTFAQCEWRVYLIPGSGGNQPPVLVPIGPKSVTTGKKLQFEINADDADEDTLNYSVSGG
ncbi:MAG: PKD domain-containing protein [Opitutales bacterium]|nr:PKD domain-containing protein [Opitutales bacterium]